MVLKPYLELIDKERNIYELAELYDQNRKPVLDYINILQDPINGSELVLSKSKLKGSKKIMRYTIMFQILLLMN